MAAANTDKFRKKTNTFSTNLNGSITASATALTCDALTNVPTDTAVTVTIDRVDLNGESTPPKREDVTGTASGSTISNLLRGEGNTTAQAHDDNAVVEITWETETWNDAVDGILAEHNQNGTHSAVTADSIKLASGATLTEFSTDGTLADNSDTAVPTEKAVKTYVDANAGNSDGWISDSTTWTYASATSFTIAGGDVTSTFTKGTRIKLTNDGSTKYFFVKSSSFSTDTTVTVFGGDDYSLASGDITATSYSYTQSPQGYPTWFDYTPTYTGSASMTYTSVTTNEAKVRANGVALTVSVYATGTTGGTASTELNASLPITSVSTNLRTGAYVRDGAVDRIGYAAVTSDQLRIFKVDVSNWGLGTSREMGAIVTYEF